LVLVDGHGLRGLLLKLLETGVVVEVFDLGLVVHGYLFLIEEFPVDVLKIPMGLYILDALISFVPFFKLP
jgi:hypothetical protein